MSITEKLNSPDTNMDPRIMGLHRLKETYEGLAEARAKKKRYQKYGNPYRAVLDGGFFEIAEEITEMHPGARLSYDTKYESLRTNPMWCLGQIWLRVGGSDHKDGSSEYGDFITLTGMGAEFQDQTEKDNYAKLEFVRTAPTFIGTKMLVTQTLSLSQLASKELMTKYIAQMLNESGFEFPGKIKISEP